MSISDYFNTESSDDYAVQHRTFGNYTATSGVHHHRHSLVRIVLTILLRVGFVLVQLGNGLPSLASNANLILVQNVLDLCCVTVMYFLTGFLIAFNGDVAGLIGTSRWIGDPAIDKNEAIVGWQATAIASAICTAAVAGRVHPLGYLMVGALLSGLIQPLLIHWAWIGWMTESKLDGRSVNFIDQGGTGVIHVAGGLSGLIGCLVLGRRILRPKDLNDANLSPGTVFVGSLLIFAGLQDMYASVHGHENYRIFTEDLSRAYINNLLAAASSTLTTVALHFILERSTFNHWTITRFVQGTIAGVVTVSAAANDYSPQVAIGLGCLGGIVFYFASTCIFHSALQDYCNAISVHLICAIVGSILAPFYSTCINKDRTMLSFSWQLICLAALMALVGAAMLIMFGMLECYDVLRNRSECLNRARFVVAAERDPPKSLLRRLTSSNTGSFYLQPGSTSNTRRHSSVDSEFGKYEEKIDNFEKENLIVAHKPDTNIIIEDGVTKVQMSELSEDQGNTGESADNDLEIRRKRFRGKKIIYALDPIEEIDEESLKEHETKKSSVQLSIDDCNFEDRNLILARNLNVSRDRGDIVESNYQLRRTIKLTNLHHEFIKEDLKVVLEPKRLTSSSIDSVRDNSVFVKTPDFNVNS